MRAVLDTDVIVSALNFRGNERRVLDLARAGRYELFLSPFILQETVGVLVRKFHWSEQRANHAIRLLVDVAVVVEPATGPAVIHTNQADNRILECAAEVEADALVTGDRRHLLPLGEHGGARIVTSAEFLALLERSE